MIEPTGRERKTTFADPPKTNKQQQQKLCYLAILVIPLTGLVNTNFTFRGQKFTDARYWEDNLFHCAISANNLQTRCDASWINKPLRCLPYTRTSVIKWLRNDEMYY